MAAEAQRVLRAFPTKSSEKEGPKPMPSFPDMVAYVQEKAAQRIKTPAKYIVGTSTIPFNPSAFAEVPIKQRPATLRDEVSVRTLSFFCFSSQIVLYLRMCLAHSAGATPMSTRLADMQDDAPAIGRYVHALLSSEPQASGSKETNPIHVYMELLQQLLSAVGGEQPLLCSLTLLFWWTEVLLQTRWLDNYF